MIMVNRYDYPRSYDFISEMTRESADRIVEAGWAIEKTLFLEIPYCPITGVGAGIARDYKHQLLYKVFFATEGVIPSLTNLQLRVVVEHEQDEIDGIIQQIIEDSIESPFTSFDQEIHRHEIEMQPIEEHYGKDMVDGTLRKIVEISSKKPFLPRYVLMFWISSYLLNRPENFFKQSIPMLPVMLSEKQRSLFVQFLSKVINEYGSNAPMKEWSDLYLGAIQKK